ncbi:MAG: hypothetical protein MI740_13270 [Halanaerobiales bacterium]|nr:hypothetical protein [Halanaerobiales bacterium]
MKRLFLFFLFFILFLFSPGYYLQGKGIDFTFQHNIFLDNNLYTVKNLLKIDLLAPFSSNTVGKLFFDQEQRWLFRITGSPLYFGYLKESEEKYRVDPDTISLLTTKFEDLDKDQYKIQLNTLRQSCHGILLGGMVWQNRKMGLALNLEGKLLTGQEIIERNYNGLYIKKDQKYYLSGFKDGIYSELGEQIKMYDHNFYSWGYSLGYNLSWQIDDCKVLQFDLENAFSKIYWYDVFTLVGMFDPNNLVLEDDGYYRYKSSFTGNFSYNDYVSSLTPEYKLSYQDARIEGGVYYRSRAYPYFNYLVIGQPLKIKLGFFDDMLNLELNYQGINAGLAFRGYNPTLSSAISGFINISF